jgi:hypothetical protein
MTDAPDFRDEMEAIMRDAVKGFAAWMGEQWQMTEAEALTLTDPSPCPAEFARGYNAGVGSISDALDLWLGEYRHD